MEETDHKETATSDVEILNTFGHEMAGMISSGELLHSVDYRMAKHDSHAVLAVDKDWYVTDVMQCLDPPDGLASQCNDPLNPPESGVKDKKQQGQEQGSSDAAQRQRKDYTMDSTAHKTK